MSVVCIQDFSGLERTVFRLCHLIRDKPEDELLAEVEKELRRLSRARTDEKMTILSGFKSDELPKKLEEVRFAGEYVALFDSEKAVAEIFRVTISRGYLYNSTYYTLYSRAYIAPIEDANGLIIASEPYTVTTISPLRRLRDSRGDTNHAKMMEELMRVLQERRKKRD